MCEIGKTFNNVNYYNKEMQKGMEDKLFFLNKLPKEENYIFVDFGCADGSMINALTSIFDDINKFNVYIGYDISETMIELAKTNYHGPYNSNVSFTSIWQDVEKKIKDVGNYSYKKVLILSSVIHEVYSYADSQEDIKEFWNKVLNSNFDYIVIRDMCPSKDIDRDSNYYTLEKVINGYNITSFENIWGHINNNKNLVHYLLKYRWKVNWDREVNENYFPIYVEDLLSYFKDFNIDYFERFRVPFLEKCWKKDFDITIDDFTHIKAIFTKKH